MAAARLMLCFAALTGCAQAEPQTPPPGSPYGPVQAMQGIAVSGFEVDAITLCADSRDECVARADRSGNGCWVEYTSIGGEQLRALMAGEDYDKYGYVRHWIEFTGRKTRADGKFGHLGAYDCQILLETVETYDKI